jgi:hypothetical protein
MMRNSSQSGNYQEGVEWLKLAASQCHSKAMNLLQDLSVDIAGDLRFCVGG